MNEYVHRMLCKNYQRSALVMIKELRKYKHAVEVIKTEAILEFEENLKLLRMFLDASGFPMPRPKWRYDNQDQSTWLFTPQKALNKRFMLLQARRR